MFSDTEVTTWWSRRPRVVPALSYAVEDDWRKLPIDVYSLSSHWSKLPEGLLRSTIESTGKEVQSSGYARPTFYPAVVRGAAMARLQTLGMLEKYILKTDLVDKLRLFDEVRIMQKIPKKVESSGVS
jgi:hypothetical protein